MKTNKWILTMITATLLLQWNCTEDPEENEPGDFLGYWKMSINPIGGIIRDPLNIILDINEDATFSLELNQRSEKQLFTSEGTWEATDDSIFLNSSECMVIDTTSDPDTLAPLADSICKAPIPLALPLETTEWNIQTSQLSVMLRAFPIDQSLVELIPQYIQILTLTKEEE